VTNWSNKTSLSKSAFDFALGVTEADWSDSQANPYSYEPTTFRMTSLVTTRDIDSKVLQDITYVYDPVGNIVKLTDGSHDCVFTNNQQVNAACGYTYDAMYRLTAAAGREHVALAQNADTDATAFLRSAWAHLNNSQQLVNYTENYVYDTAGNLTQVQHAGASTYTRYIDIDTASNRGLQRPDQGQPDFASSFDANGNQVLMVHVDSLAWDYQDRLQKVVLVPREDDQDDAEWYVYDGAGQRVRKVRETVGYGGDVVTIEEKIYLGDAEIKRVYLTTYDEYDVPTTTKVLDRTSVHVMDDKSRVALVHYWSVDTNLLELDNTNQLNTHRIRYQYGNHLGSASLELDAAGSVISYEEYLPYGGTSFVAGTSQTEVRLKEYRYSAKERDNSTGFYYYGARYYAPWVGRWVSCDPAGPVDGPNLYWFVKGNPVGLKDQDGNRSRETTDGVKFFVGGVKFGEYVGPNTLPEFAGAYQLSPTCNTCVTTVAKIENRLDKVVDAASDRGLRWAVSNVEHFRQGTGKERIIPGSQIWNFPSIRDAQEINQRRFEISFASGEKWGPSLDDGHAMSAEDYWVVQLRPNPLKEPDLYFAAGDSTFRSDGIFMFERNGNTVTVTGTVVHSFYDNYNWDPGKEAPVPVPGEFATITDSDMMVLQTCRDAQPFEQRASWTQEVTGTIIYDDKGNEPLIHFNWGPIRTTE